MLADVEKLEPTCDARNITWYSHCGAGKHRVTM